MIFCGMNLSRRATRWLLLPCLSPSHELFYPLSPSPYEIMDHTRKIRPLPCLPLPGFLSCPLPPGKLHEMILVALFVFIAWTSSTVVPASLPNYGSRWDSYRFILIATLFSVSFIFPCPLSPVKLHEMILVALCLSSSCEPFQPFVPASLPNYGLRWDLYRLILIATLFVSSIVPVKLQRVYLLWPICCRTNLLNHCPCHLAKIWIKMGLVRLIFMLSLMFDQSRFCVHCLFNLSYRGWLWKLSCSYPAQCPAHAWSPTTQHHRHIRCRSWRGSFPIDNNLGW